MQIISRRAVLTQILTGGASLATASSIPHSLWAAPPLPGQGRAGLPTGAENAAMFRIGRNFMDQFFAPALSVAIVRDSKFVFERPWGMADSKQYGRVLQHAASSASPASPSRSRPSRFSP